MNSLQDLIKRLSSIGQVTEAEEKCSECGCTPCECDDKDKVDEAKKPDADKDGIPDWADKDEEKVDEGAMDSLKALGKKVLDKVAPGDEDLLKDLQRKVGVPQTGKKPGEEEKSMKESALNLLRRYAGIQETKIKEDDVEEGNEFSGALKAAKDAGQEEFEVAGKKYKVNECGHMDMPMGAEMSPMSAVSDMASPIQVIGNPEAEPESPHMEVPTAAEAPKATYTLNIQNGENNLSMTTDMPDEIIHIMKLAGVNKGAEVTKTAAPEGEQEVEESGYENTPDNTRARDPQAHGDIRDWGRKGTGAGKPSYPGTRASGDNPMSEQAMMEDYKHFKAGK